MFNKRSYPIIPWQGAYLNIVVFDRITVFRSLSFFDTDWRNGEKKYRFQLRYRINISLVLRKLKTSCKC